MQCVTIAGESYAQFLEDVRAVVRQELRDAPTVSPEHGTAPTNDLLSIREAAALLDVTVQTVHEHKRRGWLAYHKIGSRSYIKRSDIMAALQTHQRAVKQ